MADVGNRQALSDDRVNLILSTVQPLAPLGGRPDGGVFAAERAERGITPQPTMVALIQPQPAQTAKMGLG